MLEGSAWGDIPAKAYHLDNLRSFGALISDEGVKRRFLDGFGYAAKIGCSKAVMHYTECLPESAFSDRKIEADLSAINEMSASFGMVTHLENTLFSDGKASVGFFRRLFDISVGKGLSNTGFCFDLGHVQVHSSDSFGEWFSFMEDISTAGVPLHFHLHNNNGNEDSHTGFAESEEQGLNRPAAFTGGSHYVDVVRRLFGRLPGMKILEIPPEKAETESMWLLRRLRCENAALGPA